MNYTTSPASRATLGLAVPASLLIGFVKDRRDVVHRRETLDNECLRLLCLGSIKTSPQVQGIWKAVHARTVHLVLMAWVGQKSAHRRQVMQRCILTGYTASSTTPNTPIEHIPMQIL